MKTKLLILLAMVLLFGCRSSKVVTDNHSNLEINSTAAVSQNDSASFIQEQKTETETKVVSSSETDISIDDISSEGIMIIETITELSPPDSLGNQYATRVINRESVKVSSQETKEVDNSTASETIDTNTKQETNTAVTEYSETTSESSTDLHQETTEKTKKKKTGIGIPLKLIIPFIIILIVGFIMLRLGGFGRLFGILGLFFKKNSI